MTVNGPIQVQNTIFADTAKDCEAMHYIEMGLATLNNRRKLDFAVLRGPVVNEKGGTEGPLPATRVTAVYPSFENFLETIKTMTSNVKELKLLEALEPLVGQEPFTRIFYRCIYDGNGGQKGCKQAVQDCLTKEEYAQAMAEVKAQPGLAVSNKVTVVAVDAFEVENPFEVEETFRAKDGFEKIAQKVAKHLCENLDPKTSLYFSFEVGTDVTKEVDSRGYQPTLSMRRSFETLSDYNQSFKNGLNDSELQFALKILNACSDRFTRQFYEHKMN